MASKPSKPTDRQRELNRDRPSATNRAWGESSDPGDQSFGYEGQGGYGDFRTRDGGSHERRIRDIDDAPVSDGARLGDRGQDAATPTDKRLREAVADRLEAHGKLDANQVLVAAEDGVVTLTGEVHEAWMKDCAEDIARTVTGVSEVRNAVSCDDGSASFGPPALPATTRPGRNDR